jgi:hypothetical protein
VVKEGRQWHGVNDIFGFILFIYMKLPKLWKQPQNSCTRIVKISKFITEDQNTLKAKVKSSVAAVTRCPGFVGG